MKSLGVDLRKANLLEKHHFKTLILCLRNQDDLVLFVLTENCRLETLPQTL